MLYRPILVKFHKQVYLCALQHFSHFISSVFNLRAVKEHVISLAKPAIWILYCAPWNLLSCFMLFES